MVKSLLEGPESGPELEGRGPYHTQVLRKLDDATGALDAFIGEKPVVGVVLGSGLGGFADQLEGARSTAYADLPHFLPASVPGHAGRFAVGGLGGHTVLCASGRVHLYERHPVESVVFAVRTMARVGCRAVLLTNAAGGIREDLGAGSIMLLQDHLNLTGENPLFGFPEPFIDMSHAYDPVVRDLGHGAARDIGVDVSEGVYAGLRGPTYETPAEVRMLQRLGADAVGMSTVLETIALRREGVRVGALSCITNRAAGLGQDRLSHDDVQQVAQRAQDSLVRLLSRWIVVVAGSLEPSDPSGPGAETRGPAAQGK